MEKMKAFLTQKVNKNTFKDDNVKRAIKLTLCGALIVSLMIQAIGCFFAPMSAYAAEDSSIVGTWVLNDNITIDSSFEFSLFGDFYIANTSYVQTFYSDITVTMQVVKGVGGYLGQDRLSLVYSSTQFTNFYFDSNNKRFSTNGDSVYANGSLVSKTTETGVLYRTFVIKRDIDDANAKTWLKANAKKQVTDVYDFTGETRLFNAQLTRPPMVQADDEQYVFQFDYKVYGGYTADYFIIGRSLNEWEVAYSFIDEGSGGITTMYRQQFNQSEGRWLRPRNRLIEFISNPEDPDLQQWLLDNTVLVDNTSVGIGYDYGYDIGYNDGWTNSAIGDTLKAPVDALNGIVLLQTADVTITLGGVIFTMVVLSIMLIFLKKYAGG